MNFNRESYLNYTNIESPVQNTLNWNSVRLSSDEISYGIYGVKLTKFESEDQRLSFVKWKAREFQFTEDISLYAGYVIDVDENLLEAAEIFLNNPLMVSIFMLDAKTEFVQRSVYEFF